LYSPFSEDYFNNPIIRELAGETAMETEITPEIKAAIERWIGDDRTIENCLFWNRLPENRLDSLRPVNEKTRDLKDKGVLHFEKLKKEAIAQQRECDRTLKSVFLDRLLYTDVTAGEQCSQEGAADQKGEYFRGIAFRLIGSIDEHGNFVKIMPAADSSFEVFLSVEVKSDDSHSALQLAQLSANDLKKLGLSNTVLNHKNEPVVLDPRAMRKAMSRGEKPGLGKTARLEVKKNAPSVDQALALSDQLSKAYLQRFGLEAEYFNMGRKLPNVHILREDNFNALFSSDKPLLIITSTLVCRRCRREIPGVYALAGRYPQVNFALAQLTSPIQSFKKRVFAGDIGRGSMEGFKAHAKGATPFTIAYRPGNGSQLTYAGYLSSEAHEAIPPLAETEAFLKRAFAV
jgi:hypothetical protein